MRVAKFGIKYLKHFFINFKKFCAHLAANFQNFSKHPQVFKFWWFRRKVWPKIRILRNQRICKFEPTLKTLKAYIWQSKEPKNPKKTMYNVLVICFQSLTDVLQHPVCLHLLANLSFQLGALWLWNWNWRTMSRDNPLLPLKIF